MWDSRVYSRPFARRFELPDRRSTRCTSAAAFLRTAPPLPALRTATPRASAPTPASASTASLICRRPTLGRRNSPARNSSRRCSGAFDGQRANWAASYAVVNAARKVAAIWVVEFVDAMRRFAAIQVAGFFDATRKVAAICVAAFVGAARMVAVIEVAACVVATRKGAAIWVATFVDAASSLVATAAATRTPAAYLAAKIAAKPVDEAALSKR